MSDETDTTSEVARVLGEHRPQETSYDAGWLEGCQCSEWEVTTPTWDTNNEESWNAFHAHQAAMLAEAGLLRDQAFVAMLEERIEATINLADQWEAAQKANRESLARGELAVLHIPDPQDFRYAATGCLDVPPVEAQIATQEPAGGTQGGSGDSRASGGMGERLRALGTGQTRTLRKVLRAMADEADRLESEAEMQRHSARSWRVQAEHAQGELRVIEGMTAP